MEIPRPGSSRPRSVAQFMNLKQCYLRKLYSWYVLPQLGRKCFLNYSIVQASRDGRFRFVAFLCLLLIGAIGLYWIQFVACPCLCCISPRPVARLPFAIINKLITL
jgi:hypothetical protein